MRFKQHVLVLLILWLSLGLLFAQNTTDQDRPVKGQVLAAPFAKFTPQREGTLLSSTIIFEEDFDPAPGNWNLVNGWNIGQDMAAGAVSGVNSAFTTNPYEDNALYELITPQIALPAASTPGMRYELDLWHWWSVESSLDFVYIDVLVGGQLETTLFTQTGQAAWTENTLQLTAFAGQTIQLRFRLTSDSSGSSSGFGIDDIKIWQQVYEYIPEMDLLSLNAQNFPFIYSTLSVALEGEDMSNLDETNFQVYENDVLQTNFFSVTPPSTGAGSRLVDIAFQMDNSGSMSSSIAAISANVNSFINNLAGSGVDSALGLCRYGQSASSGYPILEDNGVLTTDLTYFRNNVWARNRIDGGSEPGYHAITQSLSGFNWRPGSQKVLIIITDETPNQGGSTLQAAIDACTANGAILFALTYSSLYSTFTPITEATGGAVYDINSSFDDILTQISQIIVSNYIISYRSSNPYYDGVLRNLRFVMNYNNVSAEETGSYFPGQAPQIARSANTMNLDHQAQLDNLPITIDAIITDTYAPFTNSATLYYRNFDQSAYTALPMVNLSGDQWSAEIPGVDVQTPGIAYYFLATDGQSTSTLPSSEPANYPFTVAVLPNLPPVVQHFPQLQTNFFTPLNISASIVDDTDYVDGVMLAYRRYGQLSYTQTPMTDLGNNVFTAQISGEIVGSSGVEYYIRAWDNYGLTGASGYADNPHYVAAMLDGTVIPGGEITDFWWPAQDSPYYVSSDIYVTPGHTLHIEAGSTLIFAPATGLDIQGGLNASGVHFMAQNPYMGWNGLLINNAPGPITIQNCSIEHAIVGITFLNSSGAVTNSLISKDAENNSFTGEAGISIQGNSSPIITQTNISNYNPGILIQNNSNAVCSPSIQHVTMQQPDIQNRENGTGLLVQGDVTLTLEDIEIAEYDQGLKWEGSEATGLRNSALLTNIRIRNSSSTSRSVTNGILIQNIASLQAEELDVEGYPSGLEIDNQELTLAANVLLTNIRVRNSSSTSRTAGHGVKISNLASVSATDAEIEGYPFGLEINNETMAGNANALLTNIRVRNSSSTSRNDDFGIKIGDKIGVELDDIEVEDFSTGIDIISDPDNPIRNNALLTNIRIRNSSSTSRTAGHGVKITNLASVSATDAEIEGYPFGLEINNETMAGNANALLTNIRVRNSSSTSRNDDFGIKIGDKIGVELDDIEIEDFSTGIDIASDPDNPTRSSALLTNIRIRNSSSTSRNTGQAIKLTNLQQLEANEAIIEGYPLGIKIDNLNMTNPANAVLQNIEITNTDSNSRTETIAVNILGAVAAGIDNLDVLDFATGVYYEGNGQPFARTTPLLTNIRIRNSSSSSRDEAKGIVLKNLAAVNLSKCIIYPDLAGQANVNSAGAGVTGDGVANLNVFQSNIWGYANGMSLSNGSHADFSRSVIWKNTSEELAIPVLLDNSTVSASHSVISASNGVFPGAGNLDREPLFADPISGNFYLKPRSVLHNDDPALLIGALPYDFYALAEMHTKTFSPGWNMLGVPYLLEPGHNTPTAVFGDQLAPFYVHNYYTSILQLNPINPNAMPDSLGHVEMSLAPSYSVPNRIRSGVGYWVRNPNPIDVDLQVYGLMDDGDYLIETPGVIVATDGFFMLSNPYDRPISLNDGIELVGTVTPGVHLYERPDPINYPNHYEMHYYTLDTGIEIPAWASFIVKTSSLGDQIKLKYPSSRSTDNSQPLLAESSPNFGTASKPEWELFLNAHCNDQSSTVVLGTAKGADDAYDPMDVPAVPFNPFQSMELKVNNQDWETQAGNYVRDIKSSKSSAYSWHLTLNMEALLVEGRFSGPVRLSMDSTYRLPAGFSYRIVDVRTGASADLQTENLTLALDIDLNDPEQGNDPHLIPLKVIVEEPSSGHIGEIADLSSSNFPNPFNPSTTISYNLPADGHVNVSIYNLKGQLVRQLLSDVQSQGKHSVVWNGKDKSGRECSSGFYFYRISSGDKKISRKILMMK